MSNASPEVIELKPCPFCGAPAGVKFEHERFQIVGCMTRAAETMLCPSPAVTVYRKEDGSFNYTYWNRRV